jgi:gluconolactonase
MCKERNAGLRRIFRAARFAGCVVALFSGWTFGQNRGGPPRQFELKSETPKFWELFTEGSELEKIATGFGFTEGPVWDPHGFLYVSDEEKNKLSRVYPMGAWRRCWKSVDPDGARSIPRAA